MLHFKDMHKMIIDFAHFQRTPEKATITVAQMEETYLDRIQHHPWLKEEISHYKKLDDTPDHPDRCNDYLFGIVEKALQRHRNEQIIKYIEKKSIIVGINWPIS